MYDVIIIGAGPAGMMAASIASQNNKVLLIEKNSHPGKKLLITGGGRCNVTNLKSNRDFLELIEYNKKYLHSAISKFGPSDIYNYFINNNVPLKEEKDNQIFPVSNKANDILNALIKNTSKVEFKYQESAKKIINNELIEVITNKANYLTKKLIIATGGASYPETGSTGDHLNFAKLLNQPIKALFPAETSIILEEPNELAGTAINEVVVKFLKRKTSGNLMFTHQGLSGTAIMKMSEHLYLNSEKKISIDFLPNYSKAELFDLILNFEAEKELSSFLHTLFTKRFTEYLIDKLQINKKIKSIHKSEIIKIVDFLKDMPFLVSRVEDLDKAYVTGGGIDLNYIDTTTMESKINKNIYFVGEALDIHGPIGGYNITLALSTGHLAGSSISKIE